jgi:hypothetical protein
MLLLIAFRWSPRWGLGTVKIMLDVKFSSNTSFFTSPFPQQDKWSTFKNMLVLYHEDAQLYWQILSTAPTHQFQGGLLVLSFPAKKTRYFTISNPVQASPVVGMEWDVPLMLKTKFAGFQISIFKFGSVEWRQIQFQIGLLMVYLFLPT